MRLLCTMTVAAMMAAGSAFAAPAVSFGSRIITVTGLEPGSQVVIFGTVKISLTYYAHLQQFHTVIAADRTGTASAETDFDIPSSSVWVIADARTGEVTTATPRVRGMRTVPIGRTIVRPDGRNLSFDRSFLDLIYVHAGEGVWMWHAVDGGPGDEDGPNGMTTVDISKGLLIAGTAAPVNFSGGGTVVAIDFEELVVLVAKVVALQPGAAR